MNIHKLTRLLASACLIGWISLPSRAQSVWDVSVKGDHNPGDDITATLQRGLDTQHEHGLPVLIPHGWWKISQTIVVPFRNGGELWCAGNAIGFTQYRFEQGHWAQGRTTRLVWAGEPGEAMIKATGSTFVLRGGLSLQGKEYRATTPGAGVGLMITKNGNTGTSTGQMRFEALTCEDLPVGIQTGQTAGEANCETNTFGTLRFRRCDIGFLGVNAMGMGCAVNNVYGFQTPRFFVYEGGGMLHVENAVCHQTTLLTIRENRDTPGRGSQSGNGNGLFQFENLKIDGGAKEKFTAYDVETPANVTCVINGGILEYPRFATEGGVFAKLKGRSSLTVRDFRGHLGVISGEANTYSNSVNTPNVLVDRCQLWSAIDWQGDLDHRERDCYDAKGNWTAPDELAALREEFDARIKGLKVRAEVVE